MRPRLLLADDSVTIRRVIELTFADEDVDVLAVGDGRAAIDEIRRARPDIVLADIGMPERDGYEVAAFVKGSPEFASIPVLLLTGAFEPVDEARARAVGCDGVLVKPFEPQAVISRVKELLAGGRPDGMWASPAAQSPVRRAAAEVPAGSGAAAPSQAASDRSGSIEAYFERLDAAFATLDGGQKPAPSPPPTPTPLVHFPSETPRPAAASPPAGHERVQGPAGPMPSLAEAFAALLSAEQRQPFAPAPGSGAAEPTPEQAIEEAVHRVLARMTEQAVRDTVLDVAERLVREEIARIKATPVRPT